MKNEYKNEYKVGYTTVDSNLNLSLLGCATIIQDMVTELFEYLETDSILFVAKQESCPLDLTSRKIRKIETIRFPLNLEIKKPILEEDFEKLNNDFRQENIVGIREVYYSDTDYSKHTNNVSYVRFIMNMINS